MSKEKGVLAELMELLTKEQTLIGRYYGHEGQRKVAEQEAEFYGRKIEEVRDKACEEELKYLIKKRTKAIMRRNWHEKERDKAKKELEEVRKRIKELLRGEQK